MNTRTRQMLLVIAIAVATAGCHRERRSGADATSGTIPQQWSWLGVPTRGLVRVQPSTDDNGLYVDYAGSDDEALLAAVDERFIALGYTRSCSEFGGRVRGYRKGRSRLVMKVDTLGGMMLSVFNERGSDPLLWGVCFAGLKLGPPMPVDAAELLKE